MSPNFFFKFFFLQNAHRLVKNDNKSSSYVQIHDLGQFLGKNMTLLNLYLVLLLEWSIVWGTHWSLYFFPTLTKVWFKKNFPTICFHIPIALLKCRIVCFIFHLTNYDYKRLSKPQFWALSISEGNFSNIFILISISISWMHALFWGSYAP